MGVGVGSKTVYVTNPLNPDPSRFTVVKVEQIGSLFISLIEYPNCTNYEGKKLLVSKFDPREKATLDPHFAKRSGLLARFVPTDLGWGMAVMFAKLITEEE